MAEPNDRDDQSAVLDDIRHAMIANSQSHRSGWRSDERSGRGRTCIRVQSRHGHEQTSRDGLIELAQLSQGRGRPLDLVHRPVEAELGEDLAVGHRRLVGRERLAGSGEVRRVLGCLELPKIVYRYHCGNRPTMPGENSAFPSVLGPGDDVAQAVARLTDRQFTHSPDWTIWGVRRQPSEGSTPSPTGQLTPVPPIPQ